jgi:hypothetical protein
MMRVRKLYRFACFIYETLHLEFYKKICHANLILVHIGPLPPTALHKKLKPKIINFFRDESYRKQ